MLRSLRTLAVAAGLVLASFAAPAQAAPSIYDYYTNAPVPELTDLNPLGGEYYVDGLANVAEAVAILQANLGLLADATIALKDVSPIEMFFYSGNYDTPGSAPGSAVWYLEVFSTFNTVTGFVDVEWNGFDAMAFQRPSGTITVPFDTLKFNVGKTTVPELVEVPGPIAGAGIPALLAFGGLVAWRRRRAQRA